MNQSDQPEVFIRYLLGELSAAEQRKFEQRCLPDAACRALLRAAEQDLIDAYVRGELPPLQRQRFEDFFLLASERQLQVAFAQELARLAEAAPLQKTAGWRGLWRKLRQRLFGSL